MVKACEEMFSDPSAGRPASPDVRSEKHHLHRESIYFERSISLSASSACSACAVELIATEVPSCATLMTMPFPMSRLAPGTSAIFPSSFLVFLPSLSPC